LKRRADARPNPAPRNAEPKKTRQNVYKYNYIYDKQDKTHRKVKAVPLAVRRESQRRGRSLYAYIYVNKQYIRYTT